MSAGTRALRAVIGAYRAWSATRPPSCRFVPSCSAYADEAVAVHGAFRGAWLAARRVARCRPGGGFGYDPVPATGDDLSVDETVGQGGPLVDAEGARRVG